METFKEAQVANDSETKKVKDGRVKKKSKKKPVETVFRDEPIDLTRKFQKNHSDNEEEQQPNSREDIRNIDQTLPNISQRKRKIDQEQAEFQDGSSSKKFKKYHYSEILTDQKQSEVLKAAKSLFSKRTRTLYHWIYPNISKNQLKSSVTDAWDTLRVQEKEFYISQILERFGLKQTNLMVNPQLEGIRINPGQICNHSEAREELYPQGPKRNRPGRPPGSKNKKNKENIAVATCNFPEDATPEEFHDDPELSLELEQFEWTLQEINDEKY